MDPGGGSSPDCQRLPLRKWQTGTLMTALTEVAVRTVSDCLYDNGCVDCHRLSLRKWQTGTLTTGLNGSDDLIRQRLLIAASQAAACMSSIKDGKKRFKNRFYRGEIGRECPLCTSYYLKKSARF